MISFIVPGEPVLFAEAAAKMSSEFRRHASAPIKLNINYSFQRDGWRAAACRAHRSHYPRRIRHSKIVARKEKEVAVWKTTKRDADKIIKLCLEAMTKIVFADDAQVVSLSLKKVYGPHARLFVSARSGMSRSLLNRWSGVARLEPVGFGCRFHERKARHEQTYHIHRDSDERVERSRRWRACRRASRDFAWPPGSRLSPK